MDLSSAGHEALYLVPDPLIGDLLRVRVVGEADLATAGILEVGLQAALDRYRPARIDVDLAQTRFFDCAALRALLRVHAAAAGCGCRIMIIAAATVPAAVLQLTGAAAIFSYPPAPRRPPPNG